MPALKYIQSHSKQFFLGKSLILFSLFFTFFINNLVRADIDNLRLTRLSPNEGLSQGSVTSLLLDNNGFLWLATEGGLNFYDGYEVKYLKGPDGIFSNSIISYLHQDTKGLIWISTLYSGLYSLNPQTMQYNKVLDTAVKANPNDVLEVIHMAEDAENNLWLAVSQKLMHYRRDTGKIETLFTLKGITTDDHIVRRLLVTDQVIYIATSDGLYVMDIATRDWKKLPYLKTETPSEDQKNTKELYLDESEQLWIGTVEGLYSIQTDQIIEYLNNDIAPPESKQWEVFRNVWRLLPSKNGFYVATDDGLYDLQFANGRMKKLWSFSQSQYQVSDNNIVDMLFDNSGNLWLASRASGAFYWEPKTGQFKNIHQNAGASNPLSNDSVWSLLQTSDNTLWIGTDNGLNRLFVNDYQLESFLINSDKKALNTGSTIYQIIQNTDTSLWLVTGKGLKLFDMMKNQTISYLISKDKNSNLLSKYIWGISKDHRGRLWIMTDQGFYRFDPEQGTISPLNILNQKLDPALASTFLGSLPDRPETMLISMAGQLWLYNDNLQQLKVIYQVIPNQQQHFVAPDSWTVDKNNILWLAVSGHGLVGLDSDSFEIKHQYGHTKGLSNNSIYGVQVDRQGDIWLSSHAGISHMNRNSHHFEQFTYNDGLAANEFNGGAYTKLNDGLMAYGSMKGITLFYPEKIKSKSSVINDYKVLVTGVSLLSRSLAIQVADMNGDSVQLNHDDIGFKVSFSTLNFKRQLNTLYRIKLEGENVIDYPETSENNIMFPQLRPGDYTFSVIAINPQSGQQSNPARLFIQVGYAPYLSPIAFLTYALLVALTFLLWLRRRRMQQAILLQAHQDLLQSEERLQLALQGSGSGEWDWRIEQDCLYELRIQNSLGHIDLPHPLSLAQHLELIHPSDKKIFSKSWERFLTTQGDNFECTYRLKARDGDWQWYSDLGKVVLRNQNGSPERVAGTYTNITETRANQEKARLFGEAFKQTRDWVVILDHKFRPIAANQSFYDAFEVKERGLFSSFMYTLGIDKNKLRFYTYLISTIEAGDHWQGEELVMTRHGKHYPSLIKVSAISENGIDIDSYVVVLTDISEQKKAEEKLRALANYDALTDLPNRLLLHERMSHAFRHADRSGNSLAIFFIDLDRFKQVNDSLGHDTGDLVLKKIAKRLKKVLRIGDTVARFGGDEFVVLLESCESNDDIRRIAQKVVDEIDRPIQLEFQRIRMSPSIGIALYPNDARAGSDLLKYADVAMYHAKEQGGSSFHFYDDSMDEQAKNRLSFENKIKQAFSDNEFVNYYQPIVNVSTGKVEGFELLLRWLTDDGMVSPAEFIPIAEEIGLIIPMTLALLKRGLTDLKHWQQSGYTCYLSVNISARHLYQDTLAEDVKSALANSQISASSLRLEITESSLVKDHKKSLRIMNQLNRLGIKLSLDDFGTGYSSLQYLKKFPIDVIKVDRSFVKEIGIDKNDEAIVDTILHMAENMNKYCVAEGVENQKQLDYLTERGCQLIQGFFFSKPIPAESVREYLSKT